jgi:Leucine-rich repeat (LRR) protein
MAVFPQMPKLKNLSAIDNCIKELQDGLFDGMFGLKSIFLQHNHISSIGLHVFSPTVHHDIEFVSLSNNNLETLDVWPLALASKYRRKEKRVQYHVGNNSISKFTNNMGWRFNCSTTVFSIYLSLARNRLQHVVDLITGWNFTMEEFLCMTKRDTSKANSDETAMLDLELRANPLNCNCIDYQLYVLEKTAYAYARIYKHTVCQSPLNLRGLTILEVDLSQFVCMTSEKCPGRCSCFYQPSNKTMHVYCAYANLSQVPYELPALPDASVKYKLNVSHNSRIQHLPVRPYFVNVSIVDASSCSLAEIIASEWRELLMMHRVYLAGNRLREMPKEVLKFTVSSQLIDLGHNPWACFCDNRWMKTWLKEYKPRLVNPLAIYCYAPQRLSNKTMMEVDDEDFCSDPIERQIRKLGIIAGCSVGIASVLAVIVGLVAHRLKYRMFASWKFHPFDRDECIGEEMDYDVFLCCSYEDRVEAVDLIGLLEDSGYGVCYHERDFTAGDTIEDNIIKAIERSKRTVCLITAHFIRR